MKKSLRASYTVEAAILMPIVICMIAVLLQMGIHMYRQTREEFQNKDCICQTKAVETIQRLRLAGNAWEEIGWK